MGDVALAGEATMEADGPSMAVDVASVAVDAPSVEADGPSMAVDVASVAVDAPSVEADGPSMAVDVASVAADMPTVEADMATVEAEAEAVPMVVGAGRFRHNSKLSRPTAFAVGRLVGRYRLRFREGI
jgi:hypothetical protein